MIVDGRKLAAVLGDKTAKAFAKQLEIHTVSDLLQHYPRRYSKRGELTPLIGLPLGEMVSVVGEVVSSTSRRLKGRSGTLLEVIVTDGSERISLAFFNQHWRQNELHAGARGLFSGKIGSFSGKLQLTHPDYELFDQEIDPSAAKAWADLPIPIYPATGSLTTWKIQKSIAIVLESCAPFEALLPESLLKQRNLMRLSEAISMIHKPQVESDWMKARDSLRFHEAMILQLKLLQSRRASQESGAEIRTPGELLGVLDKSLPFELTDGQREVGAQIEKDLGSGVPMHRILQGEVGSGKTLVALRAILVTAESGGQSAFLAPTEVLASQHFRSITQMLGPDLTAMLGVRLLTGQMPAAEKKRALLDLASGKCLLAIGTHALISDQVQFFDLGMVVVDEQHRFGVGQREALKAKAKTAPHVLIMTATPIPRTLAITVFGDLDVSSLTELPAGRQQIETHVVQLSNPGLVSRIWQRVAEEVSQGHQAFVVCPRIQAQVSEDGQEEPALEGEVEPAAAEEVYQSLKLNPALTGIRIGLLHGRLSSEEKASVMDAFAANEIQVLVATTVIEVGVNIPNATAMVILDADRFGISQLHQLRGRVGRGNHQGLCLLVSAALPESIAMQRLQAVSKTLDGFKLSEIDLEIRGAGDVLGNMQSGGKSQLKLLNVVKDADLIADSRNIAVELETGGLSDSLIAVVQDSFAEGLTRS
ncbi:MAG: ATP-dependent DNA helicase RecG [Aquiluna sp.]|nr:ATP-dependent DNA helicase RecG [Aquiluna sp.]MCF8545300.1 ATP-dependent DNA helicase RecG [Aquiluna sp.]